MSSPLEAVEALGQRLREIRRRAGLSGRDLAALTGWHESKVSKYEYGRLRPTDDVIRAYCLHADADDQLEDLLATLHGVDAAYMEMRRQLGRGLGATQASLVKLAEETTVTRIVQNVVVPGILQTAEYARAILEYAVVRHRLAVGDVDGGVEKRLERQQFLYRGDRRFRILVGEQALWTTVGSEEVMAGQLDRLIAVSSVSRVTLGVIPARAALPMQFHNFVMFDDRLVTVETLSAELRITRPREIATYGQAFDLIAEQAVTGERARALILDVLRRRTG
ncbi:helix-turn-helix transcriptional regulator [Nocardia higoensis]|uniref:Helix-turn-helix transcriptional regulator n=1 Tax=Nocardia higoensis TaxID=228599 RepID=A0ABS0DIE6_9NOCA|nr:helix-turn-helix transcriptional regulator [Nocardia higoensis]MBF6358230.1 helix-turn-helix transcriptional regulator [Nocardia higoensis]